MTKYTPENPHTSIHGQEKEASGAVSRSSAVVLSALSGELGRGLTGREMVDKSRVEAAVAQVSGQTRKAKRPNGGNMRNNTSCDIGILWMKEGQNTTGRHSESV